MQQKEHDHRRSHAEHGAPLPPELAEFLRGNEYACLFHATDQGTVTVVKLPRHEISSLRGPVPIHIQHALYDHPAAPVIRTVITVLDRPDEPLAMETFTNIEDPNQRAEFEQLGKQDRLLLLVYDEKLKERSCLVYQLVK